jgi:hypothetical protein
MRRPQFPGKRYLGNSNKKEVHDLDQEDTSASGCQIDEIIRAGHAVTSIQTHWKRLMHAGTTIVLSA